MGEAWAHALKCLAISALPEQSAGVLTEAQGTESFHTSSNLGSWVLNLPLVHGTQLSFLASILSVHCGLLQVLNLLYMFLFSQRLSLHTFSLVVSLGRAV